MADQQPYSIWDHPLDALMMGLDNSWQQLKQDFTTNPFTDSGNDLLKTLTNVALGPKDPLGTYAGLHVQNPMTSKWWDALQELFPQGPGLASGAKVFKPAPDTLEGLIGSLAKAGQGIGNRGSLRPAIKVGDEIFAGERGGLHPTDLVDSVMKQRGGTSGGYNFGFQLPDNNQHFFPESLAHVLAFPEGVKKVNGMLSKGIPLSSVLEALKMGEMNGRSFINY